MAYIGGVLLPLWQPKFTFKIAVLQYCVLCKKLMHQWGQLHHIFLILAAAVIEV